MRVKWKISTQLIIRILLLLGIAFVVTVAIIGAAYSYPCEDDFSFEFGALDYRLKYASDFSAGLHAAWGMALSRQGAYLASFIFHFITPYSRWGMPGFHFMMIFVTVTFVSSLAYLVKGFKLSKNVSLFLLLMVLGITFCLSGTGNNRELFLWYTGAMSYSFETALGFFSLGCFIRILEGDNKKLLWIGSCTLALLGGWGSLEIAGGLCALHLFVVALIIKRVKQRKALIIPFVFSFLGALTNALAPGNFARFSEEVVEDTSLLTGIKNTFVCLFEENKFMFKSPLFLAICLLTLLIVVFCKTDFSKYTISLFELSVVFVFTILTQLIMIFPVTYGYHSITMGTMRTAGIYEIFARILYLMLFISFGLYLKNREIKIAIIASVCFALVVGIVFMNIDNKKIDWENAQVQCTIQDMQSGNIVKNYKLREYILGVCGQAEPGSDVEITVIPFDCKFSYGMGADEDPDWQVNRFMAYLFGLDSVTLHYIYS